MGYRRRQRQTAKPVPPLDVHQRHNSGHRDGYTWATYRAQCAVLEAIRAERAARFTPDEEDSEVASWRCA